MEDTADSSSISNLGPEFTDTDHLSNSDIKRYGRQMILPEIGRTGQCHLKKAKVLIVGVGGLGCPAAIYLAAAGVGCIGLVDYDNIELSNLHRQILHTEEREGTPKVLSAAMTCNSLNSSIECTTYNTHLNSINAPDIISGYDIVLDCTDNVATRYLLNDACVLLKKPLVSGSALRYEGQLTVYNYEDGPCYRCLYPRPPPPETVTNCSDGGVLGVVPGIIGNIQALESIKIILGLKASYAQKLLLFDGLYGTFRTIKLRPRQTTCCVCGDNPTITQLIDYEQFCGSSAADKTKTLEILSKDDRITVKNLKELIDSKVPHLLVDVRTATEFNIGRIPNSVNIPLDEINKNSEKVCTTVGKSNSKVLVVCKQGNDSQTAVVRLRKLLKEFGDFDVKDVTGGLTLWSKQIDPNFPVYW